MNYFKRYFLTVLISFSILAYGHISTLLFIDPLNISKLELSKNEFFIKEMRFQSAAIINKFSFDSAIVGTSMAENFNASEANEKLGGIFQNLSLSGSLLGERKVLLDYLLTKKNIKTLIISIDGVTGVQRNQGIPIKSWAFLYNKIYLDDFTLYTNKKYQRYISCHSIFESEVSNFVFGECPENKISSRVEGLTEWQSSPNHNSRFGGIEKWIEYKNNDQVLTSIEQINTASNLIQEKSVGEKTSINKLYDPEEFSKNIIPLIKKYPKTRFILFFPPYSIFRFAINSQTKLGVFLQYKELVRRVVLETGVYSNAEVYWFADKDFIKDISNYKDLTHYSSYYNSVFLGEFSKKHSIIDASNYQRLLDKLEVEANAINLVEFAKKFQ